MAKHPEKRKKKIFKGSRKKLSQKVAIVRRENSSLTSRQAVGRAAGILANRAKKNRRKK